MAHKHNYTHGNFSNIWADIAPLCRTADFSFANIEAPVADSRDWQTYPAFNMHHEYPEAAIAAGFNVFSLANNHSNDQGRDGIIQTGKWANKIQTKTAGSERPVYFSGIRDSGSTEIQYVHISNDSWSLLFCAVTEILNSPQHAALLNYVRPVADDRAAFCETIRALRAEQPYDLIIISIHCTVPEYVQTIPETERQFYHMLLDAGADIVWANHPHVIRPWEKIGSAADGIPTKLIMYANGNTISGQRRAPNFVNPQDSWDNTGDGLLLAVCYEKETTAAQPVITNITPHFITTYITTTQQPVIKKLDDAFIASLHDEERVDWAAYLAERKKIAETVQEITLWQ